MIPALVSLKNLIKNKSYHIDYPLFRLHYQVTACALLAFCLILTAKILFGDTIDCKSRLSNRDDFFDNLCYSQGTYTRYAINRDDLIRTAAADRGYILAHSPDSNSSTNQMLVHDMDPDKSDKLPTAGQGRTSSQRDTKGSSNSKVLPSNTSDESLGIKIVSVAYNFFFASDEKEEEDRRANASNSNQFKNIINHTYSPKTFPEELIAGTDFGEFLKNNFRSIHRLMKSNDFQFENSVSYLYTGIMVPNEGADLYSTTFWHRYYQYIPIILFLQAVFFYIPHYLWKCWENGVVSSICKQLHDNRFSASEFIDSHYNIIDYLLNCFTLNKSLIYKYYFCQLLLLVNLFAQIIILNAIFNNQFVTYGIDVFHYLFIDRDLYGLRGMDGNIDDLNNPMDFVFPKITGCTMLTLSQAGKVHDVTHFLCVLPLNILHDKFFLILWFWFLFLAVITVAHIAFDTLYLTMPVLRKYLFKRRFGPYLRGGNKHSSSLQELFLLDLIGSNSDKFAFSALLRRLNKDDWPVTSVPTPTPEPPNQSWV